MKAPKLTRRLTLEHPERVPDGAGGFTRVWLPLGELWADVRPGAGRELATDGLTTASTVSYKITVRGAPPGSQRRPSAHQRFREGDRTFEILAVTEVDEIGRYLTCYAREEVVA